MSPEQQTIPLSVEGIGETTATPYGGEDPARPCFILAHGAGAGQHHPFIVQTSTALATRGINVLTFNFLYMQRGRGGPDRPPVLEATWRAAIRCATQLGWGATRLVIGGKSMGGRIASMVVAGADAQPLPAPVHGLVLLGYPLHPPGRPDQRRDKHLPAVGRPMLFVQGTRDALADLGLLRPIVDRLGAGATLATIDDGDHSFRVRGGARANAEVMDRIADGVADWIDREARAR